MPVQSGRLVVPLRRGTKAKGWGTYGFPPSLNDMPLAYRLRYARKSRTAAHLECARLRRILRRTLVPLRPRLPFRQMYILAADRVGKYEPRTAGASRPALPVVLALRICSEGFGTTANQVQVLYSSGAQCGSTTCFCGADLRAWFGTSLRLRKNLSYSFLFDRILYHSRLSVCLHVCESLAICPVH